jgi:hypothetical protein
MDEAGFSITLPSNASMDTYYKNRPGKFKVDLSHRRELNDGVWEMALTEIQFTNNWRYSTPEFDLVAWVGFYESIANQHKSRPAGYVMSDSEKRNLAIDEMGFTVAGFITAYVKFPAAEWNNEHEFGDELARCIRVALNTNLLAKNKSTLKTLRYERNAAADTVEFKTDEELFLGFTTEHESAMRMLGLTPLSGSSLLEAKGSKVKAYMFNPGWYRIQGGFPALEVMFVYSSVCEEQHIGDHAGNLLRTVAVTVERGKRQCERYSPPTYVRLRPSTLNSIDIQLSDKTGAEVSFGDLSSLVVLQLHVRKR